jgi:hypothetical protein
VRAIHSALLVVVVNMGLAPFVHAGPAQSPQDPISVINAEIQKTDAEIASLEEEINDPTIGDLLKRLKDGSFVMCRYWGAVTSSEACTRMIELDFELGHITREQMAEHFARTKMGTLEFQKGLEKYVAFLDEQLEKAKDRLSALLDERIRIRERMERSDPKPPTRVGGDAGGGAGGAGSDRSRGYWKRGEPQTSANCPGMTATEGKIAFQNESGTNNLSWSGIPDSITGGTPVHITWTMTQGRGPWMEGGLSIAGSPQSRDDGLAGGTKGLTTDARFKDLASGFMKFNWSPEAGSEVTIRMSAGNGDCGGSVIWTYTKQQ